MLKAHRTTHTADNNLKKQKFLKHFTFKVTALSYLLHVPPYFSDLMPNQIYVKAELNDSLLCCTTYVKEGWGSGRPVFTPLAPNS